MPHYSVRMNCNTQAEGEGEGEEEEEEEAASSATCKTETTWTAFRRCRRNAAPASCAVKDTAPINLAFGVS